jgi:tetratricopeptide (TPR) repeat protein
MLSAEEQELYTSGIKAVDSGDTATGLACFEKLFAADPDPIISSYYAVCLAKERGETERAVKLCEEAMEDDPGVSLHYLNLGRVLVASGMKREAIKAFRNGLLYGKNLLISRELEQLGWRDLPVFPLLGREHILNRIAGRLLNMLGLR